jgi:hypothetical protein
MGTDRSPVDYRYISRRLVSQIVQQDQATRSRWKLTATISTPVVSLGIHKDPIDFSNELALCGEATEAIRDNTGTIAQPGDYIKAELDLTMGFVTVFMGWVDITHVPIAAMKAQVDDPESGKVLVALFGSASNYTAMKPTEDGSGGYPSDVDGLYSILDRTQEPGDPEILSERLDRDVGHDRSSRVDTAIRVLEGFKGLGEGRFEVLMRYFCGEEVGKPYGRVILGAPVWVRTPEPGPMGAPTDRPA